jgi:hypothetical protein
MLGMCMAADVRRAEEQTLLGSYLDSLASLGVQNYSRADLEIDYRMGLIISQMIMFVAAAVETSFNGAAIRIEIKKCDQCGGNLKVIASIEEPGVIKKSGNILVWIRRDYTTVLRPLALMAYSNQQLSSSDFGDLRGRIRFRSRD